MEYSTLYRMTAGMTSHPGDYVANYRLRSPVSTLHACMEYSTLYRMTAGTTSYPGDHVAHHSLRSQVPALHIWNTQYSLQDDRRYDVTYGVTTWLITVCVLRSRHYSILTYME